MSMGDQLRDYLPIQKVAENFVLALENPQVKGVINCCSGRPISVLDLVQQHCKTKASNVELNRGYYPYPDYEPLAFWGIPSKLSNLRGAHEGT
jgi:dTDP-6-deoxy-L-talose 4-dehydrogenase (NAD+)